MTWHRSEEEVEKMLEDMKKRSKGKYITQGVSFNKTCPRQMGLLKQALMSSASFSGLIKELLAINFNNDDFKPPPPSSPSSKSNITPKNKSTVKDVGNFI